MDKEELLQIADNQDDFLERMSTLHKQRLQDAITSLEKRIVDRISILQTTNAGNLVGPKANLAISQRLHAELTTLFDEEYGAAARTTVDEYRRDLPFIQDYYKQMGEAAEFTGLDKKMIDTLKKRDFAEYSQYGQKAQDQIASAMYDNVVAQAPFSSLVAAISGALVGHKDARGRPLSMYAEQMANDGIMNFHNAVIMKKGEDLGFDTFLYYGNIIKDSRDFCIKRAGNVYTKEQIQGWTFAWQGKSGPAMSDRGGYNCRHHWQPVRKGWIPEGGIEVQSAFDRAGVMPVNKLPEAIRNDPKFKAYQAWQRSVLVDKKPLNATAISESVGGKRNSIASWMNRWKKGLDLPEGWQSVVRDLEAEAGGFERTTLKTAAVPIASATAAIPFNHNITPVKKITITSAQFDARITSALNRVPERVQEIVSKEGYVIKLGDFVTNIDPSLKGVRPSGWASGSWDMADGLHNQSAKTVVVTEKMFKTRKTKGGMVIKSVRVEYVLLHEYGHAVDISLATVSHNIDFVKAWELDRVRMGPQNIKKFSYFTTNVSRGKALKEAFAESFQHALGKDFKADYGGYDPEFGKWFPNSIAYVQKEVLQA
jgi:hypothetical protein